MKKGRENDLSFLNPLLRFATIIGVITKSGGLNSKPTKWEKFKIFAMITFVTGFFCWAVYYKLQIISNRLELYTDLMASTILALFTLCTILEFGVFKRDHFQIVRNELEKVDMILTTQLTIQNPYSFYYETAGSYLFMISLITTALFTEVYDIGTLYHLFYKFYNNTFMVTVALILRNYAICLKFRFVKVNNLFAKGDMRHTVTYLNLLNLTDHFNKLFEWLLFILAIRNATWTISIAHIFIHGIQSNTLIVGNVILNCIRGSLGWIMLFLVSMSSGELSKEANKINSIRAKNLKRDDIKKIVILKDLLKADPVRISAAGFFAIDKSGLFALTGLITSYAIVLIQLNKLEEFN